MAMRFETSFYKNSSETNRTLRIKKKIKCKLLNIILANKELKKQRKRIILNRRNKKLKNWPEITGIKKCNCFSDKMMKKVLLEEEKE